MPSSKKQKLKPNIISFRGHEISLYTVSQLSLVIHRSKATLKRWQRLGVLPAAHFHKTMANNLRHRGETYKKPFYSMQEVAVLEHLIEKYGIRGNRPIPAAFTRELQQEWGIIRAKFDAGKPVSISGKLVWKFATADVAVQIFKKVFNLATDSKAEQYVQEVHRHYMLHLGAK